MAEDRADGAPSTLKVETVGRIAHITLARPEASNALSMQMRLEIVHALRAAESDPEVSIVVLDGEGPSFCAGYDLKEPYGSKDERTARGDWVSDRAYSWTDPFTRSCVADWMTLWDLLKPIVAIIHGNCLGGGTEIASLADICFAADDARLGYPPMRAMSTPDIPVLPWKMTMAQAKYLQLTGNSLTGKQAADWGWVVKSFSADELVEKAWGEARAIASIDAGLLAANKHQVNQAYELMGMRTHFAQAWSWHQLSGQVRPNARAFFDVAQKDGLKAALAWMNGPFEQEGIT